MDAGLLFANLQTRVLHGAVRYACTPAWAQSGASVYNDPFGRLYCVRAGDGGVTHHDQVFHLRPGYLFVIPAHTPGRYRCPRSMSLTWLHFTASLFGSLEPFATLGWPFAVKAGAADAARLERCITLTGQGGPAAILEADGLLRQLLACFAVPTEAGQFSRLEALRRLQPVLIYMENNLTRRLRLAELASVAHLQPTYFSNFFARHLGVPPITYLNRRRVERAAGLLFQGGARVEEIAERVGFRDVYYFSKTFKRITGLPPTAYRAQLRPEG